MRAFIAVEVPPHEGRTGGAPAPEHLTLLFLGEIGADRVDPIRTSLAPVAASVAPFEVTLDHVGAFPDAERPRVVWFGAGEGASELADLAGRVRRSVPDEGEGRGRDTFVPHLTLFRVRSSRDRESALDLLSGRRPPPPPRRFRVAEFVLKESVLSPRGATHRTVAAFALTGAKPASR